MLIRANYKLWQVQKKFHDLFPFLRLEFSRPEERKNEPLYLNKTLIEVSNVDPEVLIVAEESEKLRWLKHKFRTAFNLNIRIYKKIGGIRWKEVSEVEDMNLSEINANCCRLNSSQAEELNR